MPTAFRHGEGTTSLRAWRSDSGPELTEAEEFGSVPGAIEKVAGPISLSARRA